MKLEMVPGEFAFKALIRFKLGDSEVKGYKISELFFLSKEDVEFHYPLKDWIVMWPVEILDNGTLYCPAEEELK